MFGFLKRLKKNDKGSIPVILVAILAILVVAGGGSIDVWRGNDKRSALQNSLDAAVLHAARVSLTDDKLVEKALNDYFAGVASRHAELGKIKIEYKLAEKDDVNVIQAWASGKMPTTFLGIAGMEDIEIEVYSEVARGGTPVEIALVLDVTGSMAGHMEDLKDAAEDLVDIVYDMDNAKGDRVQVALVPYVGTVNIAPKGQLKNFMKYMDKNGDSKYHGRTLENNYLGRKDTEECKPKPSGGGGGGGGGGGTPHDPTSGGSGSDADASKYIPNFDGSSRAGRSWRNCSAFSPPMRPHPINHTIPGILAFFGIQTRSTISPCLT